MQAGLVQVCVCGCFYPHTYKHACLVEWADLHVFVWIYVSWRQPAQTWALMHSCDTWFKAGFFILSIRFVYVRINLPGRHIYSLVHEDYSSGHFHMSLGTDQVYTADLSPLISSNLWVSSVHIIKTNNGNVAFLTLFEDSLGTECCAGNF